MPRYVAFLRGINLGERRVAMSHLRALVEDLGYRDVDTFIASGNVLFSAPAANASTFEARIAQHLEASLGYAVDTFVRTAEEVLSASRTRVHPEDGQPGITVHVGFLHAELPAGTARGLEGIRTETDEFRVLGREFHWLCRIRTHESKVWQLPALKALRLPTCTQRNVTSLRKLVDQHLAAPAADAGQTSPNKRRRTAS